eukprot:Gregarina_sp_Pseudo_9__1398@NODE_1936_length_1245_cov_16_266169_g1795_i0_p1_GENE_NODE_1936_length_1245_cov_16_266169_g1795_i0NODE_1936_length_1245_cov_16_266169_g1795_i0_p1_ORF_typecomplete_len112_score0_73_NODE_1936_length_1245_cov_16_266169_g1795_i0644979
MNTLHQTQVPLFAYAVVKLSNPHPARMMYHIQDIHGRRTTDAFFPNYVSGKPELADKGRYARTQTAAKTYAICKERFKNFWPPSFGVARANMIEVVPCLFVAQPHRSVSAR